MSRKWTNIFRKKNSVKADSHGTTTAEEDLQFQPVLERQREPPRLSEKQSGTMKPFNTHGSNGTDDKTRDAYQRKEKWRTSEQISMYNVDNHNNVAEEIKKGNQVTGDDGLHQFESGDSNKGVSLMKPPPANTSMLKDVSICDEYSDPFDMVTQKTSTMMQQSTDGYREPYSLESKPKNDLVISQDGQHGNYHDPWDKVNGKVEYEDPWNSNSETTLVFRNPRAETLHKPTGMLHPGKKTDTIILNDSQNSSTSSSSASPSSVNQRFIRRKPNISRTSPQFDGRLIHTKDSSSNYSEPWGNQNRHKHFDNRLIKAEPSLEELKMISSSRSAGSHSPSSSGRGTPNSCSPFAQKHLILDQPNIPPGTLPHLLNTNWSKSRSLDMHNGPLNTMNLTLSKDMQFRRSVSDDNLISAATCHIPGGSTSNPHLSGREVYDDPWDRTNASRFSHATSHSSYGSADNQESDVFSVVKPMHREIKNPADHLQSMQRFQQRKLELHPSEAINARDIDPFLPLHSQAWYHGDISREEAESRLHGHITGSFLVRKSKTSKGGYSLSVQASKGCVHILLKCTRDDNWILGEFSAPFLSASEMVAHYRRCPLRISDTESLVLSQPVENGIL